MKNTKVSNKDMIIIFLFFVLIVMLMVYVSLSGSYNELVEYCIANNQETINPLTKFNLTYGR